MCGIAGYFSSNPFKKPDLHRLTKSLKHRGPDAGGVWISDNVGFGHRRLSIIDLTEGANQPMLSADGRYCIVFNGEIYNFKELKNKHNLVTKTDSDTEVFIELFAKYNLDSIRLLNGMFAAAIVDIKKNLLYLVRDRVGKKPLFYSLTNDELVFASELKAFKTIKEKGFYTLNNNALNEFLHLGYIPEPHTAYNEINKFPAASVGVFDGKTIKISKYWKLNPKEFNCNSISYNAAKDKLNNLLNDAVEIRLFSDVPFGTFLSGGIDSSLVTAIASKHVAGKLDTFSIAFDDKKHDESQYAKLVSKSLGTNHHEFLVKESDALELIELLDEVFDEPFADSSAIPTMLVSKLAREHVTMTLTGDGGDELFLGYGAYTWANRLHHPMINSLTKPLIQRILRISPERFKRVSELFNNNFVSLPSHIFSQEQYLFSQSELKEILSSKKYVPFLPKLEDDISISHPATLQAYFDFLHYLKDDLLVKVDRATMNYSLEARSPLLDYRVIEFAFSLPENFKMNNGIKKQILKEVLFNYLPKEIFNRPKWGFSIPLQKWLINDLGYLIDNYLNRKVVEEFQYVKWESVEKIVERFRGGQLFLYNRVWLLIVLHKFLIKNS